MYGFLIMENKIFDNTKIAFKDKSFTDLVRGYFLFKIISFPYIVHLFKKIIKIKLFSPITNFITRYTVFKQFCGGENEIKCNKTIDLLMKSNIYSILDYSVEGLENEKHFEKTLKQIKSNLSWSKQQIVNQFHLMISDFQYEDKKKYLDGKM